MAARALAADAEEMVAALTGLERGTPSPNGQFGDGRIAAELLAREATDLDLDGTGQTSEPSANGDRRESEGPLPSPNGELEGKEADGPTANGKKALAQQMSELLRLLTGRNGRGNGLAP